MGQIRLKGDPDTLVELRRSARARRITLRVSSLDGRVTLTMPPHVSEGLALEFAEEKADWIARAVKKQVVPVDVGIGAILPVEGEKRLIEAGKGRSARLFDTAITVPRSRPGPAIEAMLKALARERLTKASTRYAERIGRSYRKITLRDTRSRWGSCSHQGNLMFSWRLILAAPAVLDYVAAHEVAHLKHMDHSARFWALVEELCPDYRESRAWLRREGAVLHRFRFRTPD